MPLFPPHNPPSVRSHSYTAPRKSAGQLEIDLTSFSIYDRTNTPRSSDVDDSALSVTAAEPVNVQSAVNSRERAAEVDIIQIPRSKGNESFRFEVSRTGGCFNMCSVRSCVFIVCNILVFLACLIVRSRCCPELCSSRLCCWFICSVPFIFITYYQYSSCFFGILGTVQPPTSSNSRPTSLHRAPSLNSELIANALIKKSEFERRKCEITFNDYNLIVLISITACPR